MMVLAYIVMAFTIGQLIVSVVNVVCREKPCKRWPEGNPLVSVLIPARNEEKNIANILDDLVKQDYQNIEIIVFNDLSEDKTEHIVAGFATGDKRIRIVQSDCLPEGWLGKNYACHRLSLLAGGEYFLFIDADVRLKDAIIAGMISFAAQESLSLVSIFPKQVLKGWGEKFTVPNMNYILLSLLPLILVRKSGFPSLSAANGQFMLFKASAYRSVKPHERMKSNKVEDIAIARLLKENKSAIACLTGDETIQCRMYEGFTGAVNGFSKNVAAFFGNSLLLATLFWLVTTLGFVPVFIAFSTQWIIAYIAGYFLVRILVSVASEQSIPDNMVSVVPQQVSMGLFIYKAFLNKYFKDFQWKGRSLK